MTVFLQAIRVVRWRMRCTLKKSYWNQPHTGGPLEGKRWEHLPMILPYMSNITIFSLQFSVASMMFLWLCLCWPSNMKSKIVILQISLHPKHPRLVGRQWHHQTSRYDEQLTHSSGVDDGNASNCCLLVEEAWRKNIQGRQVGMSSHFATHINSNLCVLMCLTIIPRLVYYHLNVYYLNRGFKGL
jgi:hypothetical protein